jgi:hypothetical protein
LISFFFSVHSCLEELFPKEYYSEGQEMGTIAPAPVTKFEGRGRSRKKNNFLIFFVENNLSHFIHFQLQNNGPYALKLHLE